MTTPREGKMDAETKRFIDDVLKALGQMKHDCGSGRMSLDVVTRGELIDRGAHLIGLLPVGNWKPIPPIDD